MEVQIYKEIEKVNNLLTELLDRQKIILEQVDDITFGIIADDSFDNIPEDIQDAMYILNNYELEKPSNDELVKYTLIIQDFLDREKR